MRSSNTKLSSDVEEKRARIADESRRLGRGGATSIFGTFITAIITPSLQTARAGEVGVRLREIGFAGVRVCASAGKTVFSPGCGGLLRAENLECDGKRAPRRWRKPPPSPSCAFTTGASSAALLNEAPNRRGEGRIGAGAEPKWNPVERVSARSVSRPSLSRVATRSCVGRACVWLRQSQSYYLTSHHPCSSPPS